MKTKRLNFSSQFQLDTYLKTGIMYRLATKKEVTRIMGVWKNVNIWICDAKPMSEIRNLILIGDKMKVIWQVDDGYAGGLRPHEIDIDDGELADCETE